VKIVEIHTPEEVAAEARIIAERWPQIPENMRDCEAYNRLTTKKLTKSDPDESTQILADWYSYLRLRPI
jgi:hypothetical protein